MLKKYAADALSRLEMEVTPNPVKINIKSINEYCGLEDEDICHHTYHKTIMQNQQKYEELIIITHMNTDYSIQNFHGNNKKYSLICINLKIVIPKQLEKKT